jgi:translation elongation factor EF-Tu-like GTPase
MSGVRVRARIQLLSSREGGRSTAVVGSYRPNHNFGNAENREMMTGFLEFSQDFAPGQSREIVFTLFGSPDQERFIVAGRQWCIQEGAKLVGYGNILELLPP